MRLFNMWLAILCFTLIFETGTIRAQISRRIQEGEIGFLSCSNSRVINVQFATYGCSNFVFGFRCRRFRSCTTGTALSIIQSNCQCQSRCFVRSNDFTYGVPPRCGSVNREVTLQYLCGSPTSIACPTTRPSTTTTLTTSRPIATTTTMFTTTTLRSTSRSRTTSMLATTNSNTTITASSASAPNNIENKISIPSRLTTESASTTANPSFANINISGIPLSTLIPIIVAIVVLIVLIVIMLILHCKKRNAAKSSSANNNREAAQEYHNENGQELYEDIQLNNIPDMTENVLYTSSGINNQQTNVVETYNKLYAIPSKDYSSKQTGRRDDYSHIEFKSNSTVITDDKQNVYNELYVSPKFTDEENKNSPENNSTVITDDKQNVYNELYVSPKFTDEENKNSPENNSTKEHFERTSKHQTNIYNYARPNGQTDDATIPHDDENIYCVPIN